MADCSFSFIQSSYSGNEDSDFYTVCVQFIGVSTISTSLLFSTRDETALGSVAYELVIVHLIFNLLVILVYQYCNINCFLGEREVSICPPQRPKNSLGRMYPCLPTDPPCELSLMNCINALSASYLYSSNYTGILYSNFTGILYISTKAYRCIVLS